MVCAAAALRGEATVSAEEGAWESRAELREATERVGHEVCGGGRGRWSFKQNDARFVALCRLGEDLIGSQQR